MLTKIIHILTHSPRLQQTDLIPSETPPKTSLESDAENAIKLNAYPHWVVFPTKDWHVQFAEETLARTDKYEIECWRPYSFIDRPYKQKINGILHRVFPSYKLGLGRYWTGEISPEMIKELSNQKQKFDLVIHLHQYTLGISRAIVNKFNDLPIIASQLGGMTFKTRLKTETNLIKRMYYSLQLQGEKRALRNVDFIATLSKEEQVSLSEYNDSVIMSPPNGINVNDYFRNSFESRKELGVSSEKKIMLHVGRFIKLKGIPDIIEAYKILSQEFNLDLYIIGGNKEDELYDYCMDSGAIVKERMTHNELNFYYSAADVYVTYVLVHKKFTDSGGIGIAVLEALASNTPVVGRSLLNFCGPSSSVGVVPKNFEHFVDSIRKIFTREINFENLHASIKLYDWSTIIEKFTNEYDRLTQKYYS